MIQAILSKYADFIKKQIDFNDRSARKHQTDSQRGSTYLERANTFRSLLADLEAYAAATVESASSPIIPNRRNNLHLMPQDIKDLPEELLHELGISDSDRQDFAIMEIIDDFGGTASLDRIIVEIFRRTGKIEKRTKLVARLYRMLSKEKLFSVKGTGIYSTIPSPENQRNKQKDAHE